jgi:putative ABC transport system ATP-binding protein
MLIKLENVSKSFGNEKRTVHALEGASFTIEKGDYIVVFGPSGSGKTTLLTIMAGLQKPTIGEVIIDDISIYNVLDQNGLARLRNEYIGFVFQAFNLIPYLTALENTMLPLAPLSLSAKTKKEMAMGALGLVGLEDRASHLPTELSGGQVQRVAIARAIVNDPYILFADEPTGNLDSGTREEIMALFSELNGRGHTLIMVTHDPERITDAGRTLFINDGHVEEKIAAAANTR